MLALARIRDRLHGRVRRRIQDGVLRPAAVAVMLLDIGGVLHVILTRRGSRLRTHPGEITLPGGARDVGDASPAATALRESHEELGVAPHLLEVLGLLDDEPTTSDYVITPVVTWLEQRPAYTLNPAEVDAVCEVPLAVFADRTMAEDLGSCTLAGLVHPVRAYHHGPHRITGATARILESLAGLTSSIHEPAGQ